MKLDERMKQYEAVFDGLLVMRCPAIVRVDGRAFHTLTRKLEKPFDYNFKAWMNATAQYLCEEISTARIAYVQSDEISVLLTDYTDFETQQWFGGRVQKMCSVAASLATSKFNECSFDVRPASFDARVFSVTKDDATNYFIWRQRDCIRNSILGFAQSKASPREMHGVKCDELRVKYGWDDAVSLPDKNGVLIQKTSIGWGHIAAPLIGEHREIIEQHVTGGGTDAHQAT